MASLLDFTIGVDHVLYKISSAFLPGITELLHTSINILKSVSVTIEQNIFVVFFWFKCPQRHDPIYTFPLAYSEKGARPPDTIISPFLNIHFNNAPDRSAHYVHECIQHFVVLANLLELVQINNPCHFNCQYVTYKKRVAVLFVRSQNMMPESTLLALACDGGTCIEKTKEQKDEIPLIHDMNCVILVICFSCVNIMPLMQYCTQQKCTQCEGRALHGLYTTRSSVF